MISEYRVMKLIVYLKLTDRTVLCIWLGDEALLQRGEGVSCSDGGSFSSRIEEC